MQNCIRNYLECLMHCYQQTEGKLQEAIHNTETFHVQLVFHDTCQDHLRNMMIEM